jgi:glycolate oxidase FAD binding subunit
MIRLEGFEASVADRSSRLVARLSAYGGVEQLEREASTAVWKAIRDVEDLASPSGAVVWRISVKPSDGPTIVENVRRSFDCQALYDWGGGLVWIAGGDGRDGGVESIRTAISEVGGHATLVRAPDGVRNFVDVFQPLSAPLMDLTRKLKAAFDPAGILNPGRMYAGI